MTVSPEEHTRAARLCDELLDALERYPRRDAVIEWLELAILEDRRDALAAARAAADPG